MEATSGQVDALGAIVVFIVVGLGFLYIICLLSERVMQVLKPNIMLLVIAAFIGAVVYKWIF